MTQEPENQNKDARAPAKLASKTKGQNLSIFDNVPGFLISRKTPMLKDWKINTNVRVSVALIK